jgi:ABC-type glycerol-3-phosphate transport system substrate-binding protein
MKQKTLIYFLVLLFTFNALGCKKKDSSEKAGKEKSLSIYIDVKDKYALNVIKFLTEEYKKENNQVKLNLNNALGGSSSVVEDINKGGEADILLTSRNTMIDLVQKGLLSDMTSVYEKNKTADNYYRIMTAYGRVGDKYYGIGLIPFAVELYYNKDAISKLGVPVPSSIKDMGAVMKKLSSNSVRVPVILTDDIDINSMLFSSFAMGNIKPQELENAYDNKNTYKNLKSLQTVFDTINDLASSGTVNKSIFELGNENSINALTKGTYPVAVSIAYFNDMLKDNTNIGVINDYSLGENSNGAPPIIVNTVICTPANGKNQEEATKFIKFFHSEDTQKKLVKKGFISGNKKANASLLNLSKTTAEHIGKADDNNLLVIYNLPKKMQSSISAKVDNTLSSKSTKKEWEELLNEVYK